MSELNGLVHHLLGNLQAPRFHHDDGLLGAHHHNVQQAAALFRVSGVDDELSVHMPYAHRAEGVVEGDVGKIQRRRCADDADHVRIVVGVGGKHHGDHLRFRAKPLRKERTNGPVNQPAGDGLFFTRPAFPFDETAGDFSSRVGILPVIHR